MYPVMTMSDPRWYKLAKVFGNSTVIKPGDKVLLQAIDLDALPFLYALYNRALELGAASVDYQITLPDLERHFLQNASIDQLNFFPDWELQRMQAMDVFIAARARANSLNYNGIPAEVVTSRDKTTDAILRERCDHKRWCVTYVPTDHDALLAGMSTPDYFDYFFNAAIQDYEAMRTKNQALVNLMNRTSRVEISTPNTALDFSIYTMPAISCHGARNIPDGEVFTAPVIDSVNGSITYNAPSMYQGREWTSVYFEFTNGKIVRANCDQGKAEINKILDTDEGARYIGEFAIGTNTGITRPAKNTLFDEKIFGSFHLTPGSICEGSDNGNKSAIHWDLVKILSPEFGGGVIRFDGVPIMEDGVFVHSELLSLNKQD